MVFKLVMAASRTWRRLKGQNQLPKVVNGIKFKDGIEQSPKSNPPLVSSPHPAPAASGSGLINDPSIHVHLPPSKELLEFSASEAKETPSAAQIFLYSCSLLRPLAPSTM